jgi:hypothetical protein
MFTLALNANGYAEFKIKKKGGEWFVDMDDSVVGLPKYALYTGTEDAEEKEIVRNIFNNDFTTVPSTIRKYFDASADNRRGDIIQILMITASGSEGINLRNVRHVHIMEPYWNAVRIEQVVGRARRICSHEELPEDEKNVKVYQYLSVFSEEQQGSKDAKFLSVKKADKGKTTDQSLFDISKKKEEISRELLEAVKKTSIDCKIHAKTPAQKQLCFNFVGESNYSYVPNIDEDETEKEMASAIATKQTIFKALKGPNDEDLIVSMDTQNVYYNDPKTRSGIAIDEYSLQKYGILKGSKLIKL